MEVLAAPLRPAALATVVGLLVVMGGLYLVSTAWFLGRRPGAGKRPAVERISQFP